MEAFVEDQPSNQSVPYTNIGFFALVLNLMNCVKGRVRSFVRMAVALSRVPISAMILRMKFSMAAALSAALLEATLSS